MHATSASIYRAELHFRLSRKHDSLRLVPLAAGTKPALPASCSTDDITTACSMMTLPLPAETMPR
jgi:hypothetical protein